MVKKLSSLLLAGLAALSTAYAAQGQNVKPQSTVVQELPLLNKVASTKGVFGVSLDTNSIHGYSRTGTLAYGRPIKTGVVSPNNYSYFNSTNIIDAGAGITDNQRNELTESGSLNFVTYDSVSKTNITNVDSIDLTAYGPKAVSSTLLIDGQNICSIIDKDNQIRTIDVTTKAISQPYALVPAKFEPTGLEMYISGNPSMNSLRFISTANDTDNVLREVYDFSANGDLLQSKLKEGSIGRFQDVTIDKPSKKLYLATEFGSFGGAVAELDYAQVLDSLPQPRSEVRLNIAYTGNSFNISFPTRVGNSYTLQFTDRLTGGSVELLSPASSNWSTLSTTVGDGTVQTIADKVVENQPSSRFYRVSESPNTGSQ